MLYQLSYRCMEPHTGSEVNLLNSYLPWGVKWCEVYQHEIIHIWTAVVEKSENWSSHIHLQPQFKYELFHTYTSLTYELNKLTPLPMCGFIAQLVEHRTGVAEVTGSNPVEALIFFRLLSNYLNWKFTAMIIFTFIYNRSSNMNYFIYTSHQKKVLSYKPKESLQD